MVAALPAPTLDLPIADIAGNLAYDKREVLWCCIQYLAGQCDHANTRDNTGFNKRDTERGHFLARKNLKQWTPWDEYTAWKICMTYKRTQLSLWADQIPAWVKNPRASTGEVHNQPVPTTQSNPSQPDRLADSTSISTEDFTTRVLAELAASGLLHNPIQPAPVRLPVPPPDNRLDTSRLPVSSDTGDKTIRTATRWDDKTHPNANGPLDRLSRILTNHDSPHDRSSSALPYHSSSPDCPRPTKPFIDDLSPPPGTDQFVSEHTTGLHGVNPADTSHGDGFEPPNTNTGDDPGPVALGPTLSSSDDKSLQSVILPDDLSGNDRTIPRDLPVQVSPHDLTQHRGIRLSDITMPSVPTLFIPTNPPEYRPTAPPTPPRHALVVVKRDDNEFVEVTLGQGRGDFRSLLNEIRDMPQRKYDGASRKWTIPLEIDTIEKIHHLIEKYEIETPEDVYAAITRTVSDHRERAILSLALDHDIDLPDIEGEPFGYQKAGIAFLLKTPRGLCADAMGLGKTLQAIATIVTSGSYPAIIVVPAAVKINWKRELRKWSPVFRDRGTVALINGRYTKTIGKKVENLAEVENLNLEDPNADIDAILKYARADGQIMMIGDSALSARATAIGIRSYRRGDLGDLWPLASKNLKAVIINYDLVESWREFLIARFGETKFTLICDEAHRLKNPEAKRTKAITGYFVETEEKYVDPKTGEETIKLGRKWEKGLSDHDLTHRTILLTGTPVVNRPDELWALIRVLGLTRLFGTKEKYDAEYTGRDVRKLQDLNRICRANFMIRRKKEQVLKDLPPKIWHDVPIEIDNREEYDRAEQELADFFAETKVKSDKFERQTWKEFCEFHGLGSVLYEMRHGYADWPMFFKVEQENQYGKSFAMAAMNERLLRWGALKKVAVKGKFEGVTNWIEEFMADTDESLIVFGWHNEFLEKLSEHFKCPLIYGATPLPKRTQYVDEFQAKKHRIIFGNIQAMGEGLTLTASSNVAFFEFGWNPKDQEQAEDRAHRIGQKDNVMVHHLIADDTIDEEILAIISHKRKITNAIQDGDGVVQTNSVLDELEARMAERVARKKGQ